MQNLHKCLAFGCFLAFFMLLTGCETYGPASQFQHAKMLEHPFSGGHDTLGIYASGRVGNGITYFADDNNYVGELSANVGWVGKGWLGNRMSSGFGLFGQLGQYQVKDTSAFKYYSFGMRYGGGMIVTSGNTEFSLLQTMISLGFENGSFYDFRKSVESKKDSASRQAPNNFWIEYQMGFGVKHQFENEQTLAGQLA